MTREERERRGHEANRILNEPLLREALDAIEARAVDEMLNAPAWSFMGDRRRRRAADKVNTVRAIRAELQTAIELGSQAARSPVRVA